MNPSILVIDDDKELCRLLKIDLKQQGYVPHIAHTGEEGLLLFQEIKPDLIVLDVALPRQDGVTICERIRKVSNVPIMMVTAHAVTEEDIARALDIGADEYVLKPLGEVAFNARIKALLRRANLSSIEETPASNYADNYLSVDLRLRRVYVDGAEIRLTPTEYKLLSTFVSHPDEVLQFGQLLEMVWGVEYTSEHHYPRIYVSHLRRKIERDPKNPTYIQNEYGIGYRFVGRSQ